MSAVDAAESLRLATEHQRAGRLDEADAILRGVVENEPTNARALFQLGVLALERRRPGDAEPLLRRTLAVTRLPVACLALADALEQLGRHADAEESLREAVRLDPKLVAGWARLAELATLRGAFDDAVWALAIATRLKPADARLWNNLAAVQLHAGRPLEAEVAARKALEIVPGHAQAHLNLGRARGLQGDDEGAAAELRVAVENDPASAEARYWLGIAQSRAGLWTEALGQFRQAAALLPAWADPLIGAGNAAAKLARRVDAVEAFHEAARRDPEGAMAIESQALFLMQYGDEFGADAVHAAHLEWGRRHAASSPRKARPAREAGRKIRVGYVSPRFQRSSMAFALLPVLENHDRARFEIACYAQVEERDATTQQMQSLADAWRETNALDDAALAALVEADHIDILVDLAGHTPGNRLPAFAHRPARAAVSWLDYFNTTGVEAIDVLVTDAAALEAPFTQRFVEQPRSVGPVRYVYAAPVYAPPVSPPPAALGAPVTFASFARLSKVTEAAFDAWAEVLKGVAGSRLLLKNDTLGDPAARVAVAEAFTRRGIDAARIELRAQDSHEWMLRELSGVDIVLDTFPYNGGITTLEALWMARPVITLRGETLVGRQGAGILRAAGLDELVAPDRAGYVARAVALANDRPRLLALSTGLRERVAASPLCDAVTFTRSLEALYERLLVEVEGEVR
ncbi:hypothetical protein BWI17_08100 [Betaproteobacteria bacterium GR16-43]|nr:hypothetical protein BWI17_08100 [Betaproteobacteria bacterium GR16-43]